LSAAHRFIAKPWTCAAGVLALAVLLYNIPTLQGRPRSGQVETVPSSQENYVWVNVGNVEGHLPLNASPAGAFAPDSSALALVNKEKVVVDSLAGGNISIEKVLHPAIQNVRDLEIQSASFLDANTLFLLGTGVMEAKKGEGYPTPLLGFRWNVQQDALDGKALSFGAGGGFGRPRYFPHIKYLVMYKDSSFILWSPISSKAVEVKVPELTREPHLYSFSPDGHWLLLAQIAGGGSPNPIVVRLSEQKFVDVLSGFQDTVLSMRFSTDGKRLVTASQDGEGRIWSVPDWKLLETLSGHKGPVRWAEFSPDGRWVVSGGEDQTVRIWSADDGKAVQTLSESRAPISTVCFSPDGNFVAATTERNVLIWKKTPTGP
jgi:WD domain, G-beta repeat